MSPAPSNTAKFSWHRTWLIARREIRERTQQKTFRVILAVGALLVAAGIAIPTLIGGGSSGPDRVPAAFPGLARGEAQARARAIEQAGREGGDPVRLQVVSTGTARAQVRDGDDDVAFVIAGTPQDPAVTVLLREYSSADPTPVTAAVQRATLAERLDAAAPRVRAQVLEPVPVRAATVASVGPSPAAAAVSGVMTLVLYLIGLLLITAFANGIVSDRAGRIIERLLVAARPEEHLAGKMLGVGGAGGLQFLAWGAAALLASLAVSGDLASTFKGVPVGLIAWFPVALVLTYVLYSAIAAVLVVPIRKIEDVGGAMGLASMLQIVGYVATTTIIAPGSTVPPLIHWLSLVPFWSPLLMLARIAGGDVPAWEVAVAFVGPLLLAALLIRLAAPAYARYAIDAPGGKGLAASIKALRSAG